jgi:hypothetical protein
MKDKRNKEPKFKYYSFNRTDSNYYPAFIRVSFGNKTVHEYNDLKLKWDADYFTCPFSFHAHPDWTEIQHDQLIMEMIK